VTLAALVDAGLLVTLWARPVVFDFWLPAVAIGAALWWLGGKRSSTAGRVAALIALLAVVPLLVAARFPVEIEYAKKEILAAEKTLTQSPDAEWLPDSSHGEGWVDGLAPPPAAAWRVRGSAAWHGTASNDLFVMLPAYRDTLGIGGWALVKRAGAASEPTLPPRWWSGPPSRETRKVDLGAGWSLEYFDD
jgi:hypothetical protein